MPGLTFLNLAFLAGLAAAAIPVLIHLFSRRRAPRMQWASVRFLEELNRQRIRRIKLRQVLLLVLRALAVALFVLAMGRPVLTGPFLVSGRAPSTVCLVVDTSYSMQASRRGQSTFERARARARSVVDLFGSDDGIYLISAPDRAESATPYPMKDVGLVREKIESLEPTFRHGDLASGLELAGRLLRAARTVNKEIYVVTDLQAAAWQAVIDSAAVTGLVPADAAVCIIGPGGESVPDNVAVRDVRARRRLAAGGALELEVTLHNASDEHLESLPVEAEVGGAKAGESFVDLPPGGTVRTQIALDQAAVESDWGRVRIPEDALAVDDQRFFVLGREERTRIGVLAGGDAAARRAARFLALALDPGGNDARFAVRELPGEDLSRALLADLEVIIIAGLTRLDHAGVELLKGFVRDGGGLLVFPSERSDLRFYNDRLLSQVLPIKLARVVDAGNEGHFRLVPAVPGHPIFAGFQAGISERLTRARFQKVVKVVPGSARVLARFRNDLPALVEGERVLLFASSVDRIWNDFPTSGAFVPLVHQAVAYLAGGGEGAGHLLVGAPVERLLPAPPAPTRWQGVGPGGVELAVESVQRGGDVLLRLAAAERPGIYRVRDEGGGTVVAVAINPDTRESDLAPIAAGDLEAVFGERPFSLIQGGGAVEASVRRMRHGRELWREVLLLALIVVLVEVAMSRGKGAFTPSAT